MICTYDHLHMKTTYQIWAKLNFILMLGYKRKLSAYNAVDFMSFTRKSFLFIYYSGLNFALYFLHAEVFARSCEQQKAK